MHVQLCYVSSVLCNLLSEIIHFLEFTSLWKRFELLNTRNHSGRAKKITVMSSTLGEQTIAPPTLGRPRPPDPNKSHVYEMSRSSPDPSQSDSQPGSEYSHGSNGEDYTGRESTPRVAFQQYEGGVTTPIAEPEPGIERIVVTTPVPPPLKKTGIKKSIIVYYDIPEGSVEGLVDPSTRGKNGPPNTNQRPWLVQFNSTFLVSCIANAMGFHVGRSSYVIYETLSSFISTNDSNLSRQNQIRGLPLQGEQNKTTPISMTGAKLLPGTRYV